MKNQLLAERLLVFAPSRGANSETFIRNNLKRLPFHVDAYFGDEISLENVKVFAYGISIFVSKVLTRFGLLRLATLPPSWVASLLARHHRPDVILIEFGFHAVRVMEVARMDIPVLVHFRGADASAFRYLNVLEERYRRLFQLVSGLLVKNRLMRQRLICLGAVPGQIVISPSGADEELFHGACPSHNPAHFLAVGRFVDKKGPMLTLESFALARSMVKDRCRLTLQMVGEGPLKEKVRNLAKSLGIEQYVEFSGSMAPADIADAMRSARAFVQHSLRAPDGDEEGCPVSIMEAQLSGLPVVATFHAGIPDVVLHEETGFLVPVRDCCAMAKAMVLLADEPQLADKLGVSASSRARRKFTIDKHVSQLTKIIREVSSLN